MAAIQNLLAEGALYQSIELPWVELFLVVSHFSNCSLRFDAFCPSCNDSTTWQLAHPTIAQSLDGRGPMSETYFQLLQNQLVSMTFKCSRHPHHQMRASVRAEAKVREKNSGNVVSASLTKFGQLPSVADLATSEIDQYRKFVSKDDLVELKRAVGLAAHGVGIGSFVYLRRIFERLVDEAATRASAAGALEAWRGSRRCEWRTSQRAPCATTR
jgi:hypothetical protein